MKVLKSWLEDYIKINQTDEQLVDSLVASGTEIESIEGQLDDKIVVAKIIKIEPHPNADRLRIAEVFNGLDNIKVVCGAPNIEVGQTVPLAEVGARIGDLTIERAEIRGVESNGMLCSEKELGLGNNQSGIMILDNNFEAGSKLSAAISSDVVYDLEITPNRGDCLSHLGIAREIAAIENTEIKKQPISLKMSAQSVQNAITIKIDGWKACPQYLGRVIKGLKIGPSPDWLAGRLAKLNIKSINNVVDITNYIMFDLGQPLHAFDLDKLAGNQIIVRRASENETLESLDKQLIKLDSEVLVIADAKKPIALAGIIGSINSAIDENTSSIVLEAAVFDPKLIRKTAKKMNLRTEASYRFERLVDESNVQYALDKAAKLIKEVAGGSILLGIAKAGEKPKPLKIHLEYKKINRILGLNLTNDEINKYLKAYGFKVDGEWVIVPSYRHDIHFWQDLAEEVARIYGYDKIKDLALPATREPRKSHYYLKEFLKDQLVTCGLNEVISYPFTSEQGAESQKEQLEVANPLQPENKYLRSSLLNNLYKIIAKNSSFDPITIFEIGNVFSKKQESTHLAIALAGAEAKILNYEKTIAEKLDSIFKTPGLIKFKSVDIESLAGIKIRKPFLQSMEIDLTKYLEGQKSIKSDFQILGNEIHYRSVSKFPAVTRDLAFSVPKKTDEQIVIDSIYQVTENINRVELFDVFSSPKIGLDKKSLAFHIYLQDMNKTLNDREADQMVADIIKTLKTEHQAILRS